MPTPPAPRRPPLWLASAVLACGWGAAYSVALWVFLFTRRPVHEDVRMTYVAAEAGLRYGWSTIYDESVLRSLSAVFPAGDRVIDPVLTFLNPPLLAWAFAPLTLFSEPVAYIVWTLASLGALVLTWHIAAPYHGIARLGLLLLAVALWPVLLVFYFGQPNMLLLALLAATWWFMTRDKPYAAGAMLAMATFLKPQDVVLLPLVLLASGRYRPLAAWVVVCGVLGLATVVTLQGAGLSSWWQALQRGQAESTHVEYTLAHFFGFSAVTYALWAIQGAAALAVAWWRRTETEIVLAAGIVGTTALAFHFHELDYSILVLAAWLFLRTAPPLWQRLFLLLGVGTMQVLTYGPQTTQPAWDIATHAPQLLWDAAWLGILAAGSVPGRRAAPDMQPALATMVASSRPNSRAPG